MQKLNVLFISSWYPSKEHPTLGNFVQKHAEAVNPLVNLKVLYVTSSKKILKNFEIENNIINGVDTTIVYYKKIESTLPVWSQIKKYKNYLKAYQLGYDSIINNNQIKFNLVHCNVAYPATVFALHLKKQFNLPYVLTEHSSVYFSDIYVNKSFAFKKIVKNGIKKASVLTVVSDSLKDAMLSLDLYSNYKVIGNVVDTTIFKTDKSKIEKTDKAVILHISHMDETHKNSEGMLRVIGSLYKKRQDFIFKIISDDNLEQTKNLIKKYHLQKVVEFESTKTTKEVAQAMQEASFYLLYSNYETFSVVLAEAWCSGLPAVYSKCGGLTDIINRHLGIQVEPKNDNQLEKVLDNMLNTYHHYNPFIISEFAKSKFDSKIIGQQFLQVYEQIVASK